MAGQVSANAQTKTKPNPKAEGSTSTEPSPDTKAENRIGANRANLSSPDIDLMIGESRTTKPMEGGQPRPCPDDMPEYGRQTPDLKEGQ
jgi:hypothetical protein